MKSIITAIVLPLLAYRTLEAAAQIATGTTAGEGTVSEVSSTPDLVTDWYVAGNEIADDPQHTMTHVGNAPIEEINGDLAALNAFSGIPLSSITGFRAPYLNYTVSTLQHLQAS
ncbi:MAG: hypothetical protein CYPHOPRED_001081 [Cyphobasidiales sp. Tagirdzhanova-0007]|nr:MAG: hypothetical protein CYPHOPRED_001081 [Cyphobasidiales sp. Tagirdzhanova-0007]